MKKIVTWLLIGMIGSFTIAGLIFFTKGFNNTFNGGSGVGKTYNVDQEKTLDIQGIKNIQAKSVSNEINIIPYDENKVRAHLYGEIVTNNEDTIPTLNANSTGDKIYIEVKHKPITGFNFSNNNIRLDVYIPKGYANSLNLNSTSGEIEAKDLNLEKFEAKTVSGEIITNSILAKENILGSTSGSININSATGNLNIRTVSGEIEASSVRAKNITLNSTSGSITLSSITGDLEAKTISGEINASYENFNNKVNINSNSGSIQLKLPQNSQFNLKSKSISGDIECEFPVVMKESGNHKLDASVGNSSNDIQLETVSGEINIIK